MLKNLTLTDHEFLPPLRIERLARLNLLVGKNGVGKTAVLHEIDMQVKREWRNKPRWPSIWVDMRCNLPLLCEYEARRGGVALCDEIGHSVHHTKMADLWRYWCNVARECDLQVFASTHSWDCIQGFAAALEENPKVDGMVIRLERDNVPRQIRAIGIDQETLRIVIRDSIEIR